MSQEDSASKKKADIKLSQTSESGLVKMEDDPEKGIMLLKKWKEDREFEPKVSDEFVREGSELSARPKVEYPDLRPLISVTEVAVAHGYKKEDVVKFMQKFVDDMKPKGDPYARRNQTDYSPPPITIAGNDGMHIWLEIYKYGRQTVDRVCKKLGAYDPLYTQSIITLLVHTGYVFLYQDGTIDAIPDKVRDKILHPPEKPWVLEQRIHAFRALPSLRSMEPIVLEKDKHKEYTYKFRVVEAVDEKNYIESAKLKRDKVIIKTMLDKEDNVVEAAGLE